MGHKVLPALRSIFLIFIDKGSVDAILCLPHILNHKEVWSDLVWSDKPM